MKELPAIKLTNVSKFFRTGFWHKRSDALRNLSFSLLEGEILGYLGHNGAGKTTTFKAILDLITISSGQIEIFGKANSKETRRLIGYLPENPYFYMYLDATETLYFQGQLKGVNKKTLKQRIPAILTMVGLQDAGKKPLKKFSRGMLQRIGIAQALIHDPAILILDEPMSGLDPIGRNHMRDIILRCRDKNKSVIFSSHIIPDVEILCDRAITIKNGQLQGDFEIKDILNEKVSYWEISCTGIPDDLLVSNNHIEQTTKTGDRFLIKCIDENDAIITLNTIISSGGRILSYHPHRITLEQFFINY